MAMCPTDEAAVAKEERDQKNYEPPTETVRLARELVEMAREVCLHTRVEGRKLKLAAYLEQMVADTIRRDHAAVRARLTSEQSGGKKKPGREG